LDARTKPQFTLNPLQRRIVDQDGLAMVGFDWDNSLPGQQRLYLHWQTAAGYQTEIHDGEARSLLPYAGPWGVPTNNWSRVAVPQSGFYIPFGKGIIWVGDQLDPGQTLSAGQPLTLEQYFGSSRPVMRDYTVSVRLIGYEEDGYHWAWWDLDDGIPAMGAIPTLKWIEDSQVRAPHFVGVDENAPAGQQIGAALNLYDAFTNRLLPVLDQRITADYAWVPLGETKAGGF
jgi:hypothetical protein